MYMARQYLQLFRDECYQGDIVICKTKCMAVRECDCVEVNVEVVECG